MYIFFDILLMATLFAGMISFVFSILSIVVSEWKIFIISLLVLILSVSAWIIVINTDEQRALNNNVLIKGYGEVTSLSKTSIRVDGHKASVNRKINDIYEVDFSNLHVGDVVEMEFLDGVMENYLIRIEKLSTKD